MSTTTYLNLTTPELAATTKIREDFNSNMNIIDGRFSATYLAVQDKSSVTITGGSITGITDLVVSDGGTGVSTLTSGGVLLGSGTEPITAMAVLADGEIIVGNGTTDPVAESGATARASLGLTIGTNVQAYDAALTSISGLVYVSASFIKFSANDTYVVRTIAETKTDLSLNLVENTALSTWAGTTNITTLGTIATGVWSGTVIGAAKGGTGIANNAASTLTISGNYATTLTVTDTTGVNLPTSGTLYGTKTDSITSAQLATSVSNETGTGVLVFGTAPTFTTSITVASVVLPTLFTDSTEPTGFTDRTATLSFVPGASGVTREFTITGTHYIYINGVKTTKTTDTIAITDATGLYYIYYNVSGVLSMSTVHPEFAVPLIATLYWNTTTDAYLLGEERHGINMSGKTHEVLHNTVGVRYETGLTLTADDTTFTVTAGTIYDEDLDIDITEATTCNILYKNGTADFEWDTAQTTLYKLNVAELRYNNGNNLADVPSNQYVAYWVFATNDTTTPIVSLLGQRVDTTIANARTNNKYESLTLGTLPFQEMKLLYRVIFRNDVSPYEEVQDLRTVSNLPAGTYVATQHNVLTGLAWTLSGHSGTASYLAGFDASGSASEYVLPLGAAYGGTGVANNAASTLTITGNFATTITVTEATGITLPASGTLAANDQTFYIGTTQVAINRASAALTLAGITLTTPNLGTPSAIVCTNASGTAANLTAGTVTTNANLTGIVTSTGNATAIANKAIAIAKLADGTDGELITWSATGVIAAVAVGTAGHVLTSGGIGVAPTFQAGGAGTVDISGTPVANDYARFTDADTIEGREYSEVKTDLDLIKCRNNATTAPTTTNDSTEGYAVNSIWGDVTNDKSYICIDATATAAVWIGLYGTLADSISSANLLSSVSDETGTGVLTFATAPTFTTSIETPIINLTGGQIAFPATAAPSADVNTLDDYEEGEWTMGVSFGGGTTGITYSANTGYYTKIGNVVTISGYIQMTSKGTDVGGAVITGLPFTVVNNNAGYAAVALQLTNITFANQYAGITAINTTTIFLRETTEAGVRTDLTNADFADNSAIVVNCTYRIA